MATAEGQEFEILRERLERLERRMRVVVAGWVLSVAVFVLLGVTVQQAVSQPEVLRARRIDVVDAAGRIRIMLAVTPDGSVLAFSDAAGRQPITLGVLSDGSSALGFADAAGRKRIMLGVLSEGSPGLGLLDAAGRVLFRAP